MLEIRGPSREPHQKEVCYENDVSRVLNPGFTPAVWRDILVWRFEGYFCHNPRRLHQTSKYRYQATGHQPLNLQTCCYEDGDDDHDTCSHDQDHHDTLIATSSS